MKKEQRTYVVEKWYRISRVFDTKERAIEEKKRKEKDEDYKDIEIFEVEKIIKKL